MKELKRLSQLRKMADHESKNDLQGRRSRPSSPSPSPSPSPTTTHDQVIIKISDHHRIKSVGDDHDHESLVKKVVANSDDIASKSLVVANASTSSLNQGTRSSEENGRERLKRHRIEMAGRVWIPDIWGQEELLKDWIDCAGFDACLIPNGIISARNALIQEGRRASSGGLRIENRC